jgi:hypothetical protein
LQEALKPSFQRVEGLPKTTSVMELAAEVQMLDDPVLEDTLGRDAAFRARDTNVAHMLKRLLQAVRGTARLGSGAVVSIQEQLKHLGELTGALPPYPKERNTNAVYLKFQMQTQDGHSSKLFAELLKMQESDIAAFLRAAQREGATLGRTNLVLVGLAGSGSTGHRDYTDACNYLMALVGPDGKVNLNAVYALWVFVRPTAAAIKAMKAWLLRHPHPFPGPEKKQKQTGEQPVKPASTQPPRQVRDQQAGKEEAQKQQQQQEQGEKAAEKRAAQLKPLLKAAEGILDPGEQPKYGGQIMGAGEGNGAFLTEEMVKELRADADMKKHIIVIDQRPGDLVRAPAGWFHFVTNITGASCKFAWDYYSVKRLTHYPTAYEQVFPHLGQAGARDYMAMDAMLIGLAQQYHLRRTLGPAAAGMKVVA